MMTETPTSYPILDFDPFGAEYRSDPVAFDAMLLESSPGFIEMDGVPSAFVANYSQVTAVLRKFKAFSSLKPANLPGMERVDFFNSTPVMNYSDPPDHTRRRKVVNPAFTPKRVETLGERAGEIVDRLLDGLIEKGGEFEGLSSLTRPLSVGVLMDNFLGIPAEDQHIFQDYVATFSLLDKMQPGDPKPQAHLDAWNRGAEFCRRQTELAREGKGNSLIRVVVEHAEGGTISDDEMMATMAVLLTGGAPTIAAATAASLVNLARYPDMAERVRQEPSLASAFLEETLRLDPPVTLVMRFATEATEVGGTVIPKGMPVYVMLRVACHDPSVFPDPTRFDVDRPNVKDHVAFGQGIHTCIGNSITRIVVPPLISRVAQRMPGLRLAPRDDAVLWDSLTRMRHITKVHLAI
jgi:cytochrome P450